MRSFYVYAYIVNDTNEIFYIGKGKGNRCNQMKSRNKFFLDMINSHETTCIKIHDGLSENEALELEIEHIKIIKENFPHFRLTNMTDGGEGISGYSHSIEAKKKISESSKKMWEDRYDELCATLSKFSKSEDNRKRCSERQLGENNTNFGKFWTEEMKKALSEKRIHNGKSAGANNPRAKFVVVIDDDGTEFTYSTINDALAVLKMSRHTFLKRCEDKTTNPIYYDIRKNKNVKNNSRAYEKAS